MANEDWDEALRRIEEVRKSGGDHLSLRNLKIDNLPPEVASLTTLVVLDLYGTQINDAGLTQIEGLTGLQWLNLCGTQITDAGLTQIEGLTGLEALDLAGTQITDAGLIQIAGLHGLQTLYLNGTQITDAGLAQIAGLTELRNLSLAGTQIKDLRPLLFLPVLTEGPWGRSPRLLLNDTPALSDPALAAAMEQDNWEDQRKALLAHLRSLPEWPEEATQARQDRSTKDKAPRIFKKLTTRSAREMLETNHPLIRDRCQAVVAELDRGLAYHRMHIPNDDQALADHRQVEKALTYGKGMMESVHDAVPENFTDRPLSEEEVSRFRDALNGAVDQLRAASRYIDRPDHTPTYGGLLKLGCATAVGSVFALMPGVAVAYAIPAVFSALYGKDAVMKALASGK